MSEPVNLANLRDMTGGDKDMEKELFEVFISSSQECIDSLTASLSPETAEIWRKQAHALKGISLSLGAEKLGELCKSAQEACQQPAEKKVNMLNVLVEEYNNVVQQLQQIL